MFVDSASSDEDGASEGSEYSAAAAADDWFDGSSESDDDSSASERGSESDSAAGASDDDEDSASQSSSSSGQPAAALTEESIPWAVALASELPGQQHGSAKRRCLVPRDLYKGLADVIDVLRAGGPKELNKQLKELYARGKRLQGQARDNNDAEDRMAHEVYGRVKEANLNMPVLGMEALENVRLLREHTGLHDCEITRLKNVAAYLVDDAMLNRADGTIGNLIELTGLSATMLRNGADRREAFFEQPPDNTETPHRGRVRIPLHDLVSAWKEMHFCELLELDKDYQASYTKKKFKTDGKNLVCIKCQKKVLMGTKGDVVKWYQDRHPNSLISTATLRKLVCPCMRPSSGNDCACPICWEIVYIIKALRESFRQKGDICDCEACKPGSAWRAAIQSPHALRLALSPCGKETCPGFQLPKEKEPPEFYMFTCAVEKQPPKGADKVLPELHRKCTQCTYGYQMVMPKEGKCKRLTLSLTYHARSKINAAPKVDNCFAEKFVKVLSTYGEIINKLADKTNKWHQHMWIKQLTKRAQELEIATFDGERSIVVVTDFANRNKLHGIAQSTSEISPAVGCAVAIVLYNPGEQVDGQERPVQTDVWRIFSGAKDCAHYNALLIEEIFVHYSGQEPHKESKLQMPEGGWGKPRDNRLSPPTMSAIGRAYSRGAVPGLKKITVISDGKTSTYKGAPSFGYLYGLTEKYDVEIMQMFGAAHHMSGPVDAYGAQPARLRMKMIRSDTLPYSVYNAKGMVDFCMEYMKHPSPSPAGTWSCNGCYIYGGYNDGAAHHEDTDVPGWATVDEVNGGIHYDAPTAHSSQLYCVRIKAPWTPEPKEHPLAHVDSEPDSDDLACTGKDGKKKMFIETRFIACRCLPCRNRENQGTILSGEPVAPLECDYQHWCGTPRYAQLLGYRATTEAQKAKEKLRKTQETREKIAAKKRKTS